MPDTQHQHRRPTITMKKKPSNPAARATNIADGWEQYAPATVLAGMTSPQYRTATSRSVQGREELRALHTQLRGTGANIRVADAATRKLNRKIVAAIVADPNFGAASPLY